MNTLFGLFGREVYIRLSEGGEDFVSTTKYGKLFSRVKKFALTCAQEPAHAAEKKAPVSMKWRLSADEPDE